MQLARVELVRAGEQPRHHLLALHQDDGRRDMQQRGHGRAEYERFHEASSPLDPGRHICHRASAATIVYPSAITQPPASVTIANFGEASLVSHIPAKSSQGAANSNAMIANPPHRGRARPSAMTDRHAAITAYIGMCTCVSCTSKSRST